MEDIAARLCLAVTSWSEAIFCHSCGGVKGLDLSQIRDMDSTGPTFQFHMFYM